MTTTITGEFPFEEIRAENGDYFTSWAAAREAGFQDSQIWSITVHDDTWCFGPPQHWINLVGFVATKEHHDGDTYYEELVETESEELP